MAQYQTFPDASGDSRTLDKLMALRLPSLNERTFLDVGCNEGFFCGFAKFTGASRAVGVDYSFEFIRRARQRFPDCEFHVSDWSKLPDGEFDVILLASALHYAEDQPELIARLVDKLTPDGVLVIEMGIVSSQKAEWVKVQRGIDERIFPTMPQVKHELAKYAWKWIGASIKQDGDPVARHVLHVSRRRPVAYLLMQPPSYGKSSLAQSLFPPAGIPVVSGDQTIQRISQGSIEVDKALLGLVRETYTPFTIDKTIDHIFSSDLCSSLISAWVAQGGRQDFAVDGYVPVQYHGAVEKGLAKAGYMPVILRWERVAPALQPGEALSQQAEAFLRSMGLAAEGMQDNAGHRRPTVGLGQGYVDDLRIEGGQVVLRGWAIDEEGQAASELRVRLGAQEHVVPIAVHTVRKDVQRHLKVFSADLGYEVSVPAGTMTSSGELMASGFQVMLASGRPLHLAKSLGARLAGLKRGSTDNISGSGDE